MIGSCTMKLRFILLMIGVFCTNIALAAEDPIVTKKVEGEFREVTRNVRAAILGKGINIAHVLPASRIDFPVQSSLRRVVSTSFCTDRLST